LASPSGQPWRSRTAKRRIDPIHASATRSDLAKIGRPRARRRNVTGRMVHPENEIARAKLAARKSKRPVQLLKKHAMLPEKQ